MIKLVQIFGTALALAAIAALFWALVYVGANTGPHCPGKNPEWIGYCHEAPTERN